MTWLSTTALFGACLLSGALGGRQPGRPTPMGRHLLFAILAGAVFAVSAAFWFAAFHLRGQIIDEDFSEFCSCLGALSSGSSAGFSPKRSMAAGLLPAWFAPSFGLFDAFAIAGLISTGLIGAGLYVWGASIKGSRAGFAAAAAGLTLGPLTLLPRMMSFYPQMIAGFVLAGAGAAWAIRTRQGLAMLAAGIGISLALLMDLRGLLWGVALLPPCLLAALFSGGGWLQRAGRIALLLGPLWVSWSWLGPKAYPEITMALEAETDQRMTLYKQGQLDPSVMPPFPRAPSYVFSRTPLTDVPLTLRFLSENARLVKSIQRPEPRVIELRETVQRWLVLTVGSFGAAALALRRRPWAVAALLCSCAPFLLAIEAIGVRMSGHARYWATALPGVAVAFGVLWVLLSDLWPARLRARVGAGAGGALRVGVLALVVTGVLPTLASPVASWRRFSADYEGQYADRVLEEAKTRELMKSSNRIACQRILDRDQASGFGVWPTWYPRKSTRPVPPDPHAP